MNCKGAFITAPHCSARSSSLPFTHSFSSLSPPLTIAVKHTKSHKELLSTEEGGNWTFPRDRSQTRHLEDIGPDMESNNDPSHARVTPASCLIPLFFQRLRLKRADCGSLFVTCDL